MSLTFFQTYIHNWRLLRAAVNAVGAECENWPYEKLDREAEEQGPVERMIDDRSVTFTIDRWEKKSNGDLIISIDADGLPTIAGVKPSYQFVKRVDGTVYYP